jgi:hypothetical protein
VKITPGEGRPMADMIDEDKKKAKRKAERARLIAEKLNSSWTGITPSWRKVIDTHKRVYSETISRK